MLSYSEIREKSQVLNEKSLTILSRLIEAGAVEGGTSAKEGPRARICEEELKKITNKVFVDAFGNVIGALGNCENPQLTIWFIGHIDTVGQGEWPEAFQAKIEGNRLYGRGSSDQLAGVVSSIVALDGLKNQEAYLKEKGIRVVVMGNPHEEDCEGESIKFLLKAVVDDSSFPTWLKGLPDVMLTTEPTSTEDGMPRPYFGHRGRYLYELRVEGETGHGSVLLPIGAAEVFSRTIAEIFKQVKGPDSAKFGRDTYAFTTGKITSPSFNAHTEVASWNMDFRIAPTSQPEIILGKMQEVAEQVRTQLAQEKGLNMTQIPLVKFSIVGPDYMTYTDYKFIGLQELPGPWLPPKHPLRSLVMDIYQGLFGMEPPFDKPHTDLKGENNFDEREGQIGIRDFYNFSTDLTGLAQLMRKAEKEGKESPRIAFMGLGSGVEEQAHRKDEWCPINSLDNAVAFYMALILGLAEKKL